MGVYKEGKNWKVQVYYKDWQGNRKRKQKRGFRTKGEAKEWERDFLQQQSQGRVIPDSFTHGSSAQRYAWFKRGFDSGKPASCNTFAAR